jgi:curved DNA-binding protein CbpA
MASPLPPDPYAALGVPKDATLATIRSAHRKLVLTCHPDKVYDESVKAQKAEQFHLVQQAYEILSDETKRASYDNQVKLAELRAEALQNGSRSRPVYEFVPRPSTYETRGNVVYEERVPRPRSYEEDLTSPRFEDVRSSGRKYDVRYEERPSRRSSGRVPEEKSRKAREFEEDERARKATRDREQREQAKAAERASHAVRKKARDRGRRQEYDSKRDHHVYVESDSSSDSDSTERVVRPQVVRPQVVRPQESRRYEEPKRREYDDRPRRSRDYDSEHVDDRELKYHHKIDSAAEYIKRSSGNRPILEERRSSAGQIPVQSIRIPPPPPPPPQTDTPRRSSARSRVRSPPRTSIREHRAPEIVEPYELPLRPSKPQMPTASTDPAGLKIPSTRGAPVTRAATMDPRSPEPRPYATISRSQTMPVAPKHKKSDLHDSGYSSPGTPEIGATYSPVAPSTTYYTIRREEPEEVDDIRPRVRETSPRSSHRVERPSASPRTSTSNTRQPPPPARSATFTVQEPLQSKSSRPVNAFVRPHSNRTPSSPVQRLFGEVKPTAQYKVQGKSVPYGKDDIQYSHVNHVPRRGSADTPRDYKDTSSKPSMHRGTSYAIKQESVY